MNHFKIFFIYNEKDELLFIQPLKTDENLLLNIGKNYGKYVDNLQNLFYNSLKFSFDIKDYDMTIKLLNEVYKPRYKLARECHIIFK